MGSGPRGWVKENPAKTVEQVKSPKPAKHKKWETDQIEDFRTRWPIGTAQRMAFELMLFVGCRVSDLVRLGPGMVNADGWLVFRQQKTGGKVAIPLYRPLPGFADADTQRSLHIALTEPTTKHLTWLVTGLGKSRSPKAVSNWFSDACRAAGLAGERRRTAHGLRVTCATRLAERGATAHQIAAWTGHESLSEVQGYTRDAEKMRLLDGTGEEQKLFRLKIPEQN